MRTGRFLETLQRWAERPCALTICVDAGAGPMTVVGVLRPGTARDSLAGWWLVPFGAFEPHALGFERMRRRRAGTAILAFESERAVRFELELLSDQEARSASVE